jgi:hypothetical protein
VLDPKAAMASARARRGRCRGDSRRVSAAAGEAGSHGHATEGASGVPHGLLVRLELALPAAAADLPRLYGADLGRQVKRRLQLALRPGDALVALTAAPPVDGLAFLMVLDGLGSEADLETVVQRVLADLAEPFLDGLQPLRLPPGLAGGGRAGAPRWCAVLVRRAD